MSRQRDDPILAEGRLAAWFGPELVALALTVVMAIALAFVLGLGPFAAASGAPTTPSSPAPSGTSAAPWGNPRLAVSLPAGDALATPSVPRRPTGTQS